MFPHIVQRFGDNGQGPRRKQPGFRVDLLQPLNICAVVKTAGIVLRGIPNGKQSLSIADDEVRAMALLVAAPTERPAAECRLQAAGRWGPLPI